MVRHTNIEKEKVKAGDDDDDDHKQFFASIKHALSSMKSSECVAYKQCSITCKILVLKS